MSNTDETVILDTEQQLIDQIAEAKAIIDSKNKTTETTEKHSESVDQKESEGERTDSKTEPYLEEAIKQGYDPNYSGPNKKTPEQFVKDGSFFKKIDQQKKDIDDLKKLFKESEERSLKIERETREKVIRELQEQKEQAIAEADVDAYKEIEKRQQAEIKKISEVKQLPPELPMEIKDFAERNKSWFNDTTPENVLMAKAADGLLTVVDEECRLEGKDMSLNEKLKEVEARIKHVFPNKFKNENQDKKPLVGDVTPQVGNKSKSLADRLSSSQKAYLREAKKWGSKLTEDEYAKQLELTGELR